MSNDTVSRPHPATAPEVIRRIIELEGFSTSGLVAREVERLRAEVAELRSDFIAHLSRTPAAAIVNQKKIKELQGERSD